MTERRQTGTHTEKGLSVFERYLPRMALPSANPLLTWGYVFPSSARSCTRGRRMRG